MLTRSRSVITTAMTTALALTLTSPASAEPIPTMADTNHPYISNEPQIVGTAPGYDFSELVRLKFGGAENAKNIQIFNDERILGKSFRISSNRASLSPEATLKRGENTRTVTYQVTYTDGSIEILEDQMTLIPTDELFFVPTYKPSNSPAYEHWNGIGLEDGVSKTVTPHNFNDWTLLPHGTRSEIISSPDYEKAVNSGWTIELDPGSAELTVASPDDATEDAKVSIQFTYPDGTSEVLTVPLEVVSWFQGDNSEYPDSEIYVPANNSKNNEDAKGSSEIGAIGAIIAILAAIGGSVAFLAPQISGKLPF